MFFYQLLVFSKEISENNRARLRGKCCNAYQRELFYSAYSTFTGTWNKKSKNMIIILARSISIDTIPVYMTYFTFYLVPKKWHIFLFDKCLMTLSTFYPCRITGIWQKVHKSVFFYLKIHFFQEWFWKTAKSSNIA